jgi:hypothetical protein
MTEDDFKEIKAYHAFSRRCWTEPRPRILTEEEKRIVDKWVGVDVLGVMIEAYEELTEEFE